MGITGYTLEEAIEKIEGLAIVQGALNAVFEV